jgi:diguanylate cyclase (GGDEF)-like protein/PAS domain S-box-containing protein
VSLAAVRSLGESVEELYERAPCGYLSTSADGTILTVNTTFLTMTGYARDELLGRRFRELLTAGGRVLHDNRMLPLLHLQGWVRGASVEVVCRDGRRLPTLISSNVRTDDAGMPAIIRTTVLDATDRTSYERALQTARKAAENSAARIHILHEAAAAFAQATDTAGVVTALARTVAEHFRGACSGVWLLDEASGTLVLANAADRFHEITPDLVPLTASAPMTESIRRRDVVAIGSLQEAQLDDTGLAAALDEARMESLLAVPLVAHGQVVGVYQLAFRRRRVFEPEEADLHRTLGRQAGEAIERARMADSLRHMALHDPLTGAPNRALFIDRLERALHEARQAGEYVTVMFLDIDDFKAVNDTWGHRVGDGLVTEVARRLQTVVRSGDSIARLSGDEFAVLCAGATPGDARDIAGRVAEAVRLPVVVDGCAVSVTASIGVATYEPTTATGPASAGQLLREADAAMYRAKAQGKDGCVVYDTELDEEIARRHAVELVLQRALDGDGVVVHFQPVFDLADSTVSGVEALCRLDMGDGQLMMPGEFIDVAEERGLIVPLGRRVLEKACAQLVAWDADGAPQVTLAVNVAAEQAARADFADDVLAVLARTHCPPSRLTLELTESVLLAAAPGTIRGLQRLRDRGVGIVLDDFGTRYASLHYLQEFPLTGLKVDRSFVAHLPSGRTERAIVRCVAQLAVDLGLHCTAEGIETAGQLEFLTDLGVRGQGFALARPMDGGACREVLDRGRGGSRPASRRLDAMLVEI